jgi:hypothetical protein
MLLTSEEVWRVTGLPAGTLTTWIVRGSLVPVRRGRKGTGGSHLFSVQQVAGLCIVAALRESSGCKEEVAARIVRSCERVPDGEVDEWMRQVYSAYAEERVAKARSDPARLAEMSTRLATATAEKLLRLRDLYLALKAEGRGDLPVAPRRRGGGVSPRRTTLRSGGSSLFTAGGGDEPDADAPVEAPVDGPSGEEPDAHAQLEAPSGTNAPSGEEGLSAASG